MRSGVCSLLAISMAVSGCAIKPIPDNVTLVSTRMLVEKIRCETQNSFIDIVYDYFPQYKYDEPVDKFRRRFIMKDYSGLPRDIAHSLEKYDDAVLVLDFQLRMTEKNDLSGGTNLARPFTAGLDLLGFTVSDNRERQNYRTFRVTTNLGDIMHDRCPYPSTALPNYQYPIAGEIGIKETLKSYFDLAESNKLGPVKDWTGDTPFVDTIKFTTEVKAAFDPSFSLKPAGKGYVFQDANGGIGAGRKDEHQLIVGISFPVVEAKVKVASAGSGRRRLVRARAVRVAPIVQTVTVPLSTRAIVNDAVNRSITKQQLFGVNPLNPLGPLNQ